MSRSHHSRIGFAALLGFGLSVSCGGKFADRASFCDPAVDDCSSPAPAEPVSVAPVADAGPPLDPYCIVYTVAPLQVSVGGHVHVAAKRHSTGETFRWSSPGGTFEDPVAPETTFVCEASGEQVLSLTVSDCPDVYSATVRCVGEH